MGDRAMAQIKTTKGSLYVYTHWGGAHLAEDAKCAVLMARPRWDDEPYATRIIVDQLTKRGRDEECGYGLMLGPEGEDEYNHNSPSVIIDLVHRKLLTKEADMWLGAAEWNATTFSCLREVPCITV